jgi:hypothetical protein
MSIEVYEVITVNISLGTRSKLEHEDMGLKFRLLFSIVCRLVEHFSAHHLPAGQVS